MGRISSVARVLGAFAGLSGASHGIGEMLQGNIAPGSLVFPAWPSLTVLNGEPAMSVLPNMLVTGAVTIAVGLLAAVWAWHYMSGRGGATIMALLSAVMLLVGGGIFPPLFGIMAGVATTPWAGRIAKRRNGRLALATVLIFIFVAAIVLIFGVMGGQA